jgi:hypothetical protein
VNFEQRIGFSLSNISFIFPFSPHRDIESTIYSSKNLSLNSLTHFSILLILSFLFFFPHPHIKISVGLRPIFVQLR